MPEYLIPRARSNIKPLPVFWNGESQTSPRLLEIYGCQLSEMTMVYTAGENNYYSLIPKDTWESCGKLLCEKIWSESGFLTNIYKIELKAQTEIEKFIENFRAKDLELLPENNLYKIANEIRTLWIEYDLYNVYPWYVAGDKFGEKLIQYQLKVYSNISIEEINLLNTSLKMSFGTREELEVLQTSLDLLNKGFNIESAEVLQAIEYFVKKYNWIGFGYDGPSNYNFEYYKNLIKNYLENGELELKVRIEGLLLFRDSLKLKQQEIIEKNHISDQDQRRVKDFHLIADMTDERKEVHFPLHQVFDKVLAEIANRKGIQKFNLKYLTLEEIEESNGDEIEKMYNKRISTNTVFRFINGQPECFDTPQTAHKYADKIKKHLSQKNITGKVASKTKDSKTVGKVRIILTANLHYNMLEGEILIATMTSPEYLPAMRKAKAIITDEGGITCHAAIVSRELGIPCIIGTKIATKVLKDGDLVEMDSESGVVRVLTRAN